MQKQTSVALNAPHSNLVESHRGITSAKANEIADHYRQLGGYQVNLSVDKFRADITVYRLGDNAIQGNYRRVK